MRRASKNPPGSGAAPERTLGYSTNDEYCYDGTAAEKAVPKRLIGIRGVVYVV
jgi:hypothetical protein